MKYIFILMFVVSSFIAGCAEAEVSRNNEITRVFADASEEFKEKFDLDFSRTATNNGETIKRVSVYFRCSKAMKPENSRKFLLDILNLSLEKINQDSEIQKYLFENQLNRENIHITIYMRPALLSFGTCAIMGWNNKAFFLKMNDMNQTFKEEPYDEAIQHIQSNWS